MTGDDRAYDNEQMNRRMVELMTRADEQAYDTSMNSRMTRADEQAYTSRGNELVIHYHSLSSPGL